MLAPIALLLAGAAAAPAAIPSEETKTLAPEAMLFELVYPKDYSTGCYAAWQAFDKHKCWCDTGCALDCSNGGVPGTKGSEIHPDWCPAASGCEALTCALEAACDGTDKAHAPGIGSWAPGLAKTAGYSCPAKVGPAGSGSPKLLPICPVPPDGAVSFVGTTVYPGIDGPDFNCTGQKRDDYVPKVTVHVVPLEKSCEAFVGLEVFPGDTGSYTRNNGISVATAYSEDDPTAKWDRYFTKDMSFSSGEFEIGKLGCFDPPKLKLTKGSFFIRGMIIDHPRKGYSFSADETCADSTNGRHYDNVDVAVECIPWGSIGGGVPPAGSGAGKLMPALAAPPKGTTNTFVGTTVIPGIDGDGTCSSKKYDDYVPEVTVYSKPSTVAGAAAGSCDIFVGLGVYPSSSGSWTTSNGISVATAYTPAGGEWTRYFTKDMKMSSGEFKVNELQFFDPPKLTVGPGKYFIRGMICDHPHPGYSFSADETCADGRNGRHFDNVDVEVMC